MIYLGSLATQFTNVGGDRPRSPLFLGVPGDNGVLALAGLIWVGRRALRDYRRRLAGEPASAGSVTSRVSDLQRASEPAPSDCAGEFSPAKPSIRRPRDPAV